MSSSEEPPIATVLVPNASASSATSNTARTASAMVQLESPSVSRTSQDSTLKSAVSSTSPGARPVDGTETSLAKNESAALTPAPASSDVVKATNRAENTSSPSSAPSADQSGLPVASSPNENSAPPIDEAETGIIDDTRTLVAEAEAAAPSSGPVVRADVVKKRTAQEPLDIEHLEVTDDPRKWSTRRKNLILAVVAFNAAGGQISASIYFPALESLQADLKASDELIAATVSLFIMGQGVFPVFWSALSEIKGRKACYISAIIIYLVATIVCSRAEKIGVFVAMRVIQSLGSGAVLTLGAGTLSDIFDVHERGTKIGFFYGVPLLAPSLGPLIGGGLTEAGSWRTCFYFLIGYGVICLSTMIWLPDTFRRERSLAWRLAMKRARAHAKADLARANAKLPGAGQLPTTRKPAHTSFAPEPQRETGSTMPALARVKSALSGLSGDDNVKIHLRDVNPFAATGAVLKQKNNFIAITFSAVLFASTYCITFTASRTFAAAPYNYNALKTGLVLLCFGVGNFIGSVGGGRYSDYVFNKLRAKTEDGKGSPEMRIKSTRVAMLLVPPLYIAYAWTVQKQTNVAGPLVVLFFLGVSTMVLYSSLLSYVVDSNPGRSTSAVACNSLFRGVLAAVASQVSESIINPIGNGWFYTGFAVILIFGEVALLFVGARGLRWRERQLLREEEKGEKKRIKKEGE